MHNVEELVNVWNEAWEKDFDSYAAYRKVFIKNLTAKYQHIQQKYNAELFVSLGDCNTG